MILSIARVCHASACESAGIDPLTNRLVLLTPVQPLCGLAGEARERHLIDDARSQTVSACEDVPVSSRDMDLKLDRAEPAPIRQCQVQAIRLT